jgi:4-hydroxymandelate oxidase
MAQERLPLAAWTNIVGASGDEITLRWNRESYDEIRLRPRVMVDPRQIDMSTTLFGQKLNVPILLAPTGGHKSTHPEGELATVRGAGQAGVIMVVSTVSSTPVEEIAAIATQPLWFQLYVLRDRSLTRDLVQRAEAAGCRVLCVTVDTATTGPRNRQDRGRFRGIPGGGGGLPHLQGIKRPDTIESDIFSSARDPNVTWKDVDWLRSITRMPLVLKGVLDPADAERAVEEGVQGIIVSNHGGRNLDTSQATVVALPEIVERVDGRVPILIDGGVRRGTDVLKAIALGARAVLIGRPYRYGLAAGGAPGVARAVNILKRELAMAMANTGRTTIPAIDRSVLWS